jgi:hypothetical protein
MRRVLLALALAVASACTNGSANASTPKSAAPATLSDTLLVQRPKGGETFGLYLMGKKVGWLFTDVTLKGDQVLAVNELHFKANVGANRISERHLKESRTYEAKPGGRLLGFVVEQKGDGGDQRLEASATPGGMRVLRERPGLPNETLTIKPSKETVEDADQVRVALKRNTGLVGYITDGSDLEQYTVRTTLEGATQLTRGGVTIPVKKVTTLSDKEKVPTENFLDDKGKILEIHFGATMTAMAEPPDQAKRLDLVEVFGLTRVVLPKPPPPEAAQVPGHLTLVMQGLDEKFRTPSYRQAYKALAGGTVQVTIHAEPPKKLQPRPLVDPNGGENLKSTIIVEADNADIKSQAKAIAGSEKDAYQAALKVTQWVHDNLTKDYGYSSDRASDVLRTKRGDCTEHALLEVALLRALSIPARRVDGVVYVMNEDRVPALYWHEWVEAYVGEWTQLDPTFNQEVADATHFAVGEEGNAEITPLIGQLKVLDVK